MDTKKRSKYQREYYKKTKEKRSQYYKQYYNEKADQLRDSQQEYRNKKLGRPLGTPCERVWITDDVHNKRIKISELNDWESQGWHRGRTIYRKERHEKA